MAANQKGQGHTSDASEPPATPPFTIDLTGLRADTDALEAGVLCRYYPLIQGKYPKI